MYLYVHYNLYDNILNHKELENLAKIAIIQNYTSIQWLTNFRDAGQFAIECVATANNLRYIQVGSTVTRSDNGETGIVEEIVIEGNKMSIKGHLDGLDKIINIKIITVENVINGIGSILTNNKRNTLRYTLVNNGVPTNLVIESTKAENDNLRDIIIDICKKANIGYMMNKYNVTIYPGRDLSNTLVFSDEIGNITNEQLTYDITEAYNYAIVAGEGEDPSRLIILVENPKIPNSINNPYNEVYVDAKDIKRTYKDSNNNEVTYNDTQYTSLLKEKGLKKLYECQSIQSYKCDLNLYNKTHVFGEDYLLGDIISIKSKKYSLNIKVRIVSVKEIWENGYKNINLTLENI